MSNQTELNQVERDIKAYKAQSDLGNALEKLKSNRDFQKLVMDGYLKDEAVRLVHLKADPNMQEADQQAGIDRDLMSIAVLGQYFVTVGQRAAIAGKQLTDAEELRTELLAEGF